MPNVPTSHSFRPNPNASIEEMLERINGITTHAVEPKTQSDSGVFSNLKLPNGAPIETKNNRDANGEFFPFEPTTLAESKVSESMVEQLLCKFLLARGEVTVRQMSEQVGLPFQMIDDVVAHLKSEQLLGFIGQSAVNGYTCKLTEAGRNRAVSYSSYCSYFGAAPVAFSDYVASVKAQTIGNQHPGEAELNRAFSDLLIDDNMMTKLGPAVNSGKGMFLFGSAGNGKTSIAERITSAFGPYVWVPRAITVDRDIIRVFDPMSHEECPLDEGEGIISDQTFDHRWVRIKRPTIVVGGELTMEHLELQYNSQTGISEAPVQMKSNTGVLLIDDFGRQRMTVDELLNRWIVPLEKRYDYLNTSNGKKVQVPFDQLVVFSTNLEPKDLVDDAFLRRIPYKIEVPNPSIENFVRLFKIMCTQYGFEWRPKMVQYLIQRHYAPIKRELRNCHPRDLLLQARNYCRYFKRPIELTKESIDFACENYFSIM
ncbi:MAG: AAA family ATPase [Mariniblastus sp.]|nr:AAA family ATPase [Mariniblastus sp.]MDG2183171.1 AAA family ATPase [Mariniblastus sp.]